MTDHFEKARQMRDYIRITSEQGPSQQLIDFINHDKQFGVEIGLESFETLSTQAQHEIMLSKLNPSLTERIALEGLIDKLKKVGSKFFNKKEIPEKHSKGKVRAYYDFQMLSKQADLLLAYDKYLVDHVPTKKDVTAWVAFDKNVTSIILPKLNSDLGFHPFDYKDDVQTFEKSGWDQGKFKSAQAWINKFGHEYDSICVKYDSKLKQILAWAHAPGEMDDDDRIIAPCVNRTTASAPFGNSVIDFSECRTIVAGVAPYFDE